MPWHHAGFAFPPGSSGITGAVFGATAPGSPGDFTGAAASRRSPGNGKLGRGLRRRTKTTAESP